MMNRTTRLVLAAGSIATLMGTAIGVVVLSQKGSNTHVLLHPVQSASAIPGCNSSTLSLTAQGGPAAAGQSFVIFHVTNTGSGDCRISGVPSMQMTGPGGAQSTRFLEDPTAEGRIAHNAQSVTMAPQQVSSFYVGESQCNKPNGSYRNNGPYRLEFTFPGIGGAVGVSQPLGFACAHVHVVISAVQAGSQISVPGFTTGGSPPVSIPGSKLPVKTSSG